MLSALQQIWFDPPHSDLTRKETLLDKCSVPPNAARAYQPRAGAENICPPRTTARAIPEPPGRDPPGGMADRLGSLSFAFRLLASKRAADVAAPLRPGKYELDYGGHEVPRLSKNHWSSPVRRLM
jgi:hypothetical protein